MPEKWTGRLRGHMFNENISVRELAGAAGWSYSYVSALLHGKRYRPGAREVLEEAYEKALEEKKRKRRRTSSTASGPPPGSQSQIAPSLGYKRAHRHVCLTRRPPEGKAEKKRLRVEDESAREH